MMYLLIVTFCLIIFISILSVKKGFDNLEIKREVKKNCINEGENFKVSVIIENKKWLPVTFLVLRELIPKNMEYFCNRIENASNIIEGVSNTIEGASNTIEGASNTLDRASSHGEQLDGNYKAEMKESSEYNKLTSYSIFGYEKVKRTYLLKNINRGTYLLRNMEATVGDFFGFLSKSIKLESVIELVVYPKLINTKEWLLTCTNIQGDNIVKRWIYKDPLYIKGIREYNVEDRMKDIHWKSSAKMNKLMVKEYDYTSERELIFILNVQADENFWANIDRQAVERGLKLCASLSKKAIEEGINVGMWTNAFVNSYCNSISREVQPSLNSFKAIMNLCARVSYSPQIKFDVYLNEKIKYYNRNCTYVVLAHFLNEKSRIIINKMKMYGIVFKIIDISNNGTVEGINGIEKLNYGGENR